MDSEPGIWRDRLAVDLIRWLPKATFGRVMGFVSRRKIPKPLRAGIYGRFARHYGVDMSQLDLPIEAYPNFGSFFSRGLRPGARAVDPDPAIVVSPVDGALVESGTVVGGRMLQAKGIDYTLRGLLASDQAASVFDGGCYATFYLAPGDYHRIHAPATGQITGYHHVPGAFFPVGPRMVRNVAGLFSRNERLITYLETPVGSMAVVKVAATGVGHISVTYDGNARTRMGTAGQRVSYTEKKSIAKGDELGAFHLGSTVILLFERDRVKLYPFAEGEKVRVGQPIAEKAKDSSGEVAA